MPRKPKIESASRPSTFWSRNRRTILTTFFTVFFLNVLLVLFQGVRISIMPMSRHYANVATALAGSLKSAPPWLHQAALMCSMASAPVCPQRIPAPCIRLCTTALHPASITPLPM